MAIGLQNSANHDTREIISKKAQTSHDTIHKVEKILEKAPQEVIVKVRSGDESINKVFNDIKREEKRTEIIAKLVDCFSFNRTCP